MKSCEKRAPSALGPGVMKERTKLGHKTKSAATAVHVYLPLPPPPGGGWGWGEGGNLKMNEGNCDLVHKHRLKLPEKQMQT